jgi:hypothetical protein
MDSLDPCRRLRAGKVLHDNDNSVCACVRAFFPLAAITCFSSIPVWFFMPVPTAHAHADVLYHMVLVGLSFCHSFSPHSVSLLFLTTLILSLFLFGLVRTFVGQSAVLCLVFHRSLFSFSAFHGHHTFSSLFFILRIDFFLSRVVIVWPLSGVYFLMSFVLPFPLLHFPCLLFDTHTFIFHCHLFHRGIRNLIELFVGLMRCPSKSSTLRLLGI